jgi:hypothetical protein
MKPQAVKKENAGGPYFQTGLGRMPVGFFRTISVVTIARGMFFGYMFWAH